MTVLVRKLGTLSLGRTNQGIEVPAAGLPPAPALYQFPPPSGCKQKAASTWGPGRHYDTGCSQHFGYFLRRLTDTS